MTRITLPFRLRGYDGCVTVEYSVNEDPVRWGYPLLGLGYPSEVARGFPVCRASVAYPGEGYAAAMGWIQVIRYCADGEEETILVDTAPQLMDTQAPYFSWGVCPEFFDAPSTTQKGIIWTADAFLVASLDALMSKIIQPVCGFTWGYTTQGGLPEPLPIAPAEVAAWSPACSALSASYPSWYFDRIWADERYP